MKSHKLCLAEITKAQSHTEMSGVEKKKGDVFSCIFQYYRHKRKNNSFLPIRYRINHIVKIRQIICFKYQ